MDDDRVWAFEESLWTGGKDLYEELIDAECVMALPQPPFLITGEEAIEAVADTPRWSNVAFSRRRIVRPEEGLIVLAYMAVASRVGADSYQAYCTTTLRRLEHGVWRVVQHHQTPPLIVS